MSLSNCNSDAPTLRTPSQLCHQLRRHWPHAGAREAPCTQAWPFLQHPQSCSPSHLPSESLLVPIQAGEQGKEIVAQSKPWPHYWSNRGAGRLRDMPKARKEHSQKIQAGGENASPDRQAIFCPWGHTRIGRRKTRMQHKGSPLWISLALVFSFRLGGGGGSEESGHQCAFASGRSFSSSCCYRSR